MPLVTLAPNEQKLIQTSALYLSIINANGQFVVKAPKLGTLAGLTGRQYVLDGIQEVLLINPNVDDIEVEYEIANIRIYGGGAGVVSIDNKPTIKRIEEPIAVTASATVENGTMAMLSPNNFLAIDDVEIQPDEFKLIVPGREALLRKVLLQNISEEFATVRIGGDNPLLRVEGVSFAGSKLDPASLPISTTAPIYARNNSTKVVKLCGYEVFRT